MTRSMAVKAGRRLEAVSNREVALPPQVFLLFASSCPLDDGASLAHSPSSGPVAHIFSYTFVLAPTFMSFCSALGPRTRSQHLLELHPTAGVAGLLSRATPLGRGH